VDFNICFYNHDTLGRDSIFDFAWPLQETLITLGHRCYVSERAVVPGMMNIIYENFVTEDILSRLIEANIKYGINYGLVATEYFDTAGFNCSTNELWSLRAKNFARAAMYASFVWGICNDTASGWLPKVPYARLNVGYSPQCMLAHTGEFLYDFVVLGKPCDARVEAVLQLQRHGYRAGLFYGLTLAQRREVLSRTRWMLGVPSVNGLPIASLNRIWTALHHQVPIILERAEVDAPIYSAACKGLKPADVGKVVEHAVQTARLNQREYVLGEQLSALREIPYLDYVQDALKAVGVA
jgi:hypothetical protein